MMILKKALPRRTFLRGIGATVALPLLDAMIPSMTALAQTPANPVRRLGFVYIPMGSDISRWTPAGEGGALTELSTTLSPLTPVMNHVTVVSNLELKNAYPGTHATSNAAFLSAAKAKWTESSDYFLGTTVDQIAAKQMGQETQLPSLELAMDLMEMVGQCDNGYACVYQNNLSWSSPTTPLPAEAHPRIVFERLFGEGGSSPERRAALGRRASLLDWVRDDIDRLQRQIGASDRTKVSEYLDTVREVERRIQKAETQTLDNPLPDLERPVGVPAAYADHAKLMFDLQVLALQGDVTRVITFQLARETSNRTYPEIGVPDPHHPTSHHGGDPEKIAKIAKINQFHVSLFGYFLEKLASVRDGDGTLLDHSLYLYGSGMGNPNIHDHVNLPVIVAGGAAGKARGGRHIKYAEPQPLANLHLTMLDAVGVRLDSFADSTGKIDTLFDRVSLAGWSVVSGFSRTVDTVDTVVSGFSRTVTKSVTGDQMMRERSVGARLILSALLALATSATPLFAQQMDKVAIRHLLEHPTNVNASQPDGMTALHSAAYLDDLELVDKLLRAGANPRAMNKYGVTPLSLACTNANVAMVERLLEGGADPNAALPGGETVLMTAARTGRVGAVRALLVRGADVHAKESRHGQTAIMWAAAEGHVEVIEALIEAGADFKTPLESGFTPLLFAVREGRIGAVKALLKAGADVNEPVTVRKTPKLPEEGARPLRPGTTPLMMAVSNAHFELAAQLVDAGADPNTAALGYTVLHAIVRVRKPGVGDNDPAPEGSGTMTSIEFVKRIAAHGANVNARMTRKANLTNTRFDEIGATPFLLAAVTADAELMKTLAGLGADPLATNEEGSTALMAAAGLGARSPGEDAGTEEEVVEAVQVALSLGADLNAVDKHGETAMHGAAYKNLPAAVKLLADKGARIDVWNKRNEFGWTPLTIARGYRFGNFKPSQVTVDAIETVMRTAGITPPTEKEEKATAVDIYAPKPPAAKPASPR